MTYRGPARTATRALMSSSSSPPAVRNTAPVGRSPREERHPATGSVDAFGDRIPTQPFVTGRGQVGLLDDRHVRASDATSRRMPSAYRRSPPPPPWQHLPARSTILVATAVVTTAIIGVLGYLWAVASPVDEADGAIPDGVTVFDDKVPAVANLDPGLSKALRQAATDAADDKVEFYVNSGLRSPEYQDQLLGEAISKYGSEKEAARWVATPDTSLHVSGDAIDIGPTDATTWLSRHGSDYGLCRIYGNEPWHYELRPDAVGHGCPRMYANATQDPRLHPTATG